MKVLTLRSILVVCVCAALLFGSRSNGAGVISCNLGGANHGGNNNETHGYGQHAHNYALIDGVVSVANVYTSELSGTSQGTADANLQRIRVTGQSQIEYTNNVADMTAGVFNDASADGNGNYVKFSGMTNSSITITCEAGGWRSGNFAGWQIAEISTTIEGSVLIVR